MILSVTSGGITQQVNVITSRPVVNLAVMNGRGQRGPVGPSTLGTILPDAVDEDFNMQVNSTIYLPDGVLTQDRHVEIPEGASGNFLKLYNNEAGFSWLLTGVPIYLSDGITEVTQLLADTNYFIEFISGKWRILN